MVGRFPRCVRLAAPTNTRNESLPRTRSYTPNQPTVLFSQDTDGAIGRFLRCVRLTAPTNTRAALFANLTGLSPDGTMWPPATWHFLLHLLHALRLLLAGKALGSQQLGGMGSMSSMSRTVAGSEGVLFGARCDGHRLTGLVQSADVAHAVCVPSVTFFLLRNTPMPRSLQAPGTPPWGVFGGGGAPRP